MLNLLINLKKCRYSGTDIGGNALVLLSFIAGSVLFWLFGIEAYKSGILAFSDKSFCIAFAAAFVLIVLSAFSQLGPVQVAVSDALLEFLISFFALSKLLQGTDINSVSLLCLQIFAIIMIAMLFSLRALKASVNILRKTVSDKKYAAEFAVNIFILISLLIISLIICLNAF